MKNISVLIQYYNRRDQFIQTMKSIERTKYDKSLLEFVVFDDASSEEHRIDDCIEMFPSLNIVFKRLEPKEKDWGTRCNVVPTNMGIEMCSHDFFLINGAELFHRGDIIFDFSERVSDNNYVCYATYEISKEQTFVDFDSLDSITGGICLQSSKSNNRMLPFCAGMSKSAFSKVGKFDESFKWGDGRADVEWVDRMSKTDIEMIPVDSPYTIHQWHPRI